MARFRILTSCSDYLMRNFCYFGFLQQFGLIFFDLFLNLKSRFRYVWLYPNLSENRLNIIIVIILLINFHNLFSTLFQLNFLLCFLIKNKYNNRL